MDFALTSTDLLWGLTTLLAAVMVLAASTHALMHKRDSRSAFAWIAFSLILPILGPLIYLVFGINRLRSTAQSSYRGTVPEQPSLEDQQAEHLARQPRARVGKSVTGTGLVACDEIAMLENGEASYPAMLEDIAGATTRLYCATYIFQLDDTGKRFIDAFCAARDRGVDVRLIVDGLGGIAYPPGALRELKRRGLSLAVFNPIRLLPPSLHINLRNHRKMLLIDGRIAYTGGQNISDRHLVERSSNPKRARDLHFRLSGKIVAELDLAFIRDWIHATGELQQPPVPAEHKSLSAGRLWARVIPDGPNDDLDKLTKLLVGVMSTANRRIWIMTPYFLPSLDLIGALVAAQLRGVDVRILLPERTNIHLAHWAALHNLRHLLSLNLQVFLQPAPFIHTKALLIDDDYALVGSANLDPRSLRLNFELQIEVFDRAFATRLEDYFQSCLAESRLLNQDQLDALPWWIKLRNALAWLFSPYL